MTRATLISATLGEDGQIEPPLGPLYIAAALEHIGWEIDFRDYQLYPAADAFEPDVLYRCLAGHHRILLISCFVDMLPVVISACRQVKAARPGTCIILGGPGPTAGARQLLEEFSDIDGIVLGEGEDTIREWAASYKDTSSNPPNHIRPIPGMVVRIGQQVVEGRPRPRILQSERIPSPAYHLLDWRMYSGGRIITTRGCPYHCSFCDVAPLWGRKAVYRDLSSTVDEMILLRDRYGIRGVAIADDTFVLDRDRVRNFCKLLIERKAGLMWGCFGRINLMSESLIELMASAGCRAVFYGIDSGSPAVLKRTIKEIKRDSILPTLRTSAKYFEVVEASFIWGYPFESYDDFAATLDVAAEASRLAPKVNVQLHMLSPLPSSPMYTEFGASLAFPEAADRDWLLLPAVLLDERASKVRCVIDRAPHLFPGFFTFPTPEKDQKRKRLREVRDSLDSVVGETFLDPDVGKLLRDSDVSVEQALLHRAENACELVGTGMALGAFRRIRQDKVRKDMTSAAGIRGLSMVRERNDSLARG